MEVGDNYPESKYLRKTLHLRTLFLILGLIGITCLRKVDFIQSVVKCNIKNSKIPSRFWDRDNHYTSSTLCI